MAKHNNSKGPANRSAQHLAMLPEWKKMEALLSGTAAMRKAGAEFMPPHPGESTNRYFERLNQATLFNQVALTLGGWVGRPFRDPLELNEDVPEEIRALEDDIDRQGTNMDSFCRAWFKAGLAKAFCHVLIEQSNIIVEEGATPTIADQESQNIRPYWSLIQPEEVIAARMMVIDGVETLTHVRISERTMEIDPEDLFAEVEVHRIRVYDRVQGVDKVEVMVTVWKQDRVQKRNGMNGWVKEVLPRAIGIDFIPLLTFYSDQEGFMLGKSPLQDLADLNVKHWNSSSDQDGILRIARFPILAGKGVEDLDGKDPQRGSSMGAKMADKDGAIIGPHTILFSENPQSLFYYVEHKGIAIAAGAESLEHLEGQMAGYGSEFLKKGPDRQTATARTLDSLESVSPLQAVTLNFKDAVQRALVVTAQWMGVKIKETTNSSEGAGTITIVTEFGPEDVSRDDLNTLQAARKAGDISRKLFLNELERRGLLGPDFDFDRNEEELEKEALAMSATPPSKTDLDPAQPEPQPG